MKVVVIDGAEEGVVFTLHDGVNMVGRDITSRVRLLDPRISRKHCRIRKIGRSLFLSDLGTKNGTSVNGVSVVERELKIGDQIKLGNTTLKVIEEDYAPEKSAQIPRSVSSFKQFFANLLSHNEVEAGDADFAKFARRRFRPIWRPSVDTDPPEGRQDTVVSHSDPD